MEVRFDPYSLLSLCSDWFVYKQLNDLTMITGIMLATLTYATNLWGFCYVHLTIMLIILNCISLLIEEIKIIFLSAPHHCCRHYCFHHCCKGRMLQRKKRERKPCEKKILLESSFHNIFHVFSVNLVLKILF